MKNEIELPPHVLFYNIEIQKSVFQYINQLNDKEYTAYIIAKEHLGTSFNIVKSNGYINWKSSQPLEKVEPNIQPLENQPLENQPLENQPLENQPLEKVEPN